MATNHVHAVVISGLADQGPWAVVTDRDVLGPAGEARERLAGSCVTSDPLTVKPSQSLEEAVRLMREHDLSHLLVSDPASGRKRYVVTAR